MAERQIDLNYLGRQLALERDDDQDGFRFERLKQVAHLKTNIKRVTLSQPKQEE